MDSTKSFKTKDDFDCDEDFICYTISMLVAGANPNLTRNQVFSHMKRSCEIMGGAFNAEDAYKIGRELYYISVGDLPRGLN